MQRMASTGIAPRNPETPPLHTGCRGWYWGKARLTGSMLGFFFFSLFWFWGVWGVGGADGRLGISYNPAAAKQAASDAVAMAGESSDRRRRTP